MGVVAVLLLEGLWTLAHDEVDHPSEVFGGEVLQFLLELHLVVVGHLVFVLLLLEEVVLDRPPLLAPAGARLPFLTTRLLPGTVIGILGR